MTKSIGSCVVVGGGPAGVFVAKNLKKKGVKVTIVDRQDYLDWSLASPRSVVRPDDVETYSYVMPHEEVCQFHEAEFVHCAVSRIGPKSVSLENGTTLEADTVVVAIGGQYASGGIWKPSPDQTTRELRIAAFRSELERAKKAKSIVIAGAGPTGVEVAGEIKSEFPDKKVTLVGTYMSSSSASMRKRSKEALKKLGVLFAEGRVEATGPDGDGKVATTKGETIDADLVWNAAGMVYAGKDLADDALSSDVTSRGQFSCRPTLQLNGCDSVFACGDVVEVPEGCHADVKGIKHAEDTAKIVAANVVNSLSSKPLSEFKWSAKPVATPMMSALGPNVGVGDLGAVVPNFMANVLCRKLKCKDYYMSLQKANFGKGKTW